MTAATAADEVVGFDLGHGESAVARLSLAPSSAPQILPIHTKNSQVTAVGVYHGQTIVGEAVIRSVDVTGIRVGFKRRPPGTEESRQATIDFVREYHRILTENGQILGGDRTHYFVGCPTGWTDAEMQSYRDLLGLALPRVSVVRESRAALIQAKEERKIAPERLRSSIVVIDLGSSTIDVSYIFGGVRDDRLDVGTEVGGHLIEKEILRRAIQRSRVREELEAFFAGNESERRVAEVLCREVKERYWALESTAAQARRNSFIPIGNDGLYLEPMLNAAEMESILAAPLPELGGVSWSDAFVRFLDDIRAQLAERGTAVDVLVLTGGASKMSFVRDLCREQFPSAEFVWCTPPEEAVAIGLARWGSIELRTSAFSLDVAELCRTTAPEIVSKHMEELRTRLAAQVATDLSNEVIASTARQWRSGDIGSLDEMQAKIIERATAWLHSDASIASIRRAYEPVLKAINDEIDQHTHEICMRRGVPPSSLRLTLHLSAGDEKLRNSGAFHGIPSAIAHTMFEVILRIAQLALVAVGYAGGPPGWLAISLLAVGAAVLGADVDQRLKAATLPLRARSLLLSDNRLKELTGRAATTLEIKVKQEFGNEQMQSIRAAIADQVSTFLNARADEVKWIVAQ